MYQRIEGGMWRHVWVVSDIHGCYQWLMDELKRRHFNPYEDLLISVGDVIDRGPDSVKCLQLIHEKWFRAVRGNHEQILKIIINLTFKIYVYLLHTRCKRLDRAQAISDNLVHQTFWRLFIKIIRGNYIVYYSRTRLRLAVGNARLECLALLCAKRC